MVRTRTAEQSKKSTSGRKARPVSSSSPHNPASTANAKAKVAAVPQQPIHRPKSQQGEPTPALLTASHPSPSSSSSPKLLTPPTPATLLTETASTERRSGRLLGQAEAKAMNVATTVSAAPSPTSTRIILRIPTRTASVDALALETKDQEATKKRKAAIEEDDKPTKRQRQDKATDATSVVKPKTTAKPSAPIVPSKPSALLKVAPVPHAAAKVKVQGARAGYKAPTLMKSYTGHHKVQLLYWRAVTQLGVYPSTKGCTWALEQIRARQREAPKGPVRMVWGHDLTAAGFEDDFESFEEFAKLFARGKPAGVDVAKQLSKEPVRIFGEEETKEVEGAKALRASPDEFLGDDGGRYRWRNNSLQYAVHPRCVVLPERRWTAVHSSAWLSKRHGTGEIYLDFARYDVRRTNAEERRQQEWRTAISWMRRNWEMTDQEGA